MALRQPHNRQAQSYTTRSAAGRSAQGTSHVLMPCAGVAHGFAELLGVCLRQLCNRGNECRPGVPVQHAERSSPVHLRESHWYVLVRHCVYCVLSLPVSVTFDFCLSISLGLCHFRFLSLHLPQPLPLSISVSPSPLVSGPVDSSLATLLAARLPLDSMPLSPTF
jgi:hypothetical protein